MIAPDDPRHGTYAGAMAHRREREPLCDACKDPEYLYNKRLKRRIKQGVRNFVPLGEQAWAKVSRYPAIALSEASGVHVSKIGEYRRRGPGAQVHRRTRDRILNAQPAYTLIGIERRMRALVALGYSAAELSRRLGITIDTARRTLRATPIRLMDHPQALAIVELYQQLENTPAPPSRSASYARARAVQNGWHAPAAWDDIDNDPTPHTPTNTLPGNKGKGLDLTEYDFLISCGESPEQAAHRLGVTVAAVDQARARARKAA